MTIDAKLVAARPAKMNARIDVSLNCNDLILCVNTEQRSQFPSTRVCVMTPEVAFTKH